jgi:hypothetical protein
MFLQTLLSSKAAGLVVSQNSVNLSQSATAPLTGSTLTGSTLTGSTLTGSTLVESTITSNGKTSALRVDNDFVQITADFTNDGISDVVQVNRRTGISQLFANQTTPIGTPIDLPTLPPNWDFSGLSDRDGNGIVDLYWNNPTTGQSAVWLSMGRLTPVFTYQIAPTGTAGVTLPVTVLNLGAESFDW